MLYNTNDILETTRMITENNLDVRTITMGISLRDCADPDVTVCARKIYDKITRCAKDLVKVGTNLEAELGVPIIHKRISVTPISLVGEACQTDTYVPLAKALDDAAKAVGVNFIGGFSALVEKGCTHGDSILIDSIPEALATTDIVCSSVAVGSTKAGINMNAVRRMGEVVKKTADLTRDQDALAAPNSLFSATLSKTIPLWQALSTALRNRRQSSMSVSPALVLSSTLSKAAVGPILVSWPRPSRKQLSRLPASDSSWPKKRPNGWEPNSGSLTCPLPQRRL